MQASVPRLGAEEEEQRRRQGGRGDEEPSRSRPSAAGDAACSCPGAAGFSQEGDGELRSDHAWVRGGKDQPRSPATTNYHHYHHHLLSLLLSLRYCSYLLHGTPRWIDWGCFVW